MIVPGDMALRSDIQRLADYGVIKGPVTTWPLAWGPIVADIQNVERIDELPRDVIDAITRVKARSKWEMRTGEVTFNTSVSGAEEPTRIRSFQNTPRESAELSAGLSYTGDRFSVSLNGQSVDSPADGKDFRADGSMIGVVLGNYSFTVNTLDRWWGPGWDGSLTMELSNVSNLPIRLYYAMKIGQLSFLELTTPAEHPYGSPKLHSKYQGQTGPTASRGYTDYEHDSGQD